MRLQRQSFPLTLRLHSATGRFDTLSVSAYNSDGGRLEHSFLTKNSQLIIQVLVQLPNQVIFEFAGIGHNHLMLQQLTLAGVRVDSSLLPNISEYLANSTINTVQLASPIKTTRWHTDGCARFDIFHPNPFAYHFLIGNKINVL